MLFGGTNSVNTRFKFKITGFGTLDLGIFIKSLAVL